MNNNLTEARQTFTEGIIKIAQFWGFPRALGAIFACLYLSEDPLSLNDLAAETGLTKGSLSTNLKTLSHLKLVKKHIFAGDRRDYYTAETELWDIVRKILRQRQDSEFDQAIGSVRDSLEILEQIQHRTIEAEFAKDRISALDTFFKQLDSLVATFMALDSIRLANMVKLFGGKGTH